MWDGSEHGWQLVLFDHNVSFVEFHFSESGPNEKERKAAIEFHEPIRENPKLIDECPGFAIAKPFGEEKLQHLHQLQREYNLKLTIVEIPAGDYSVRNPDGYFQSWLLWPGIKYREPIIKKMLDHGVKIVNDTLD